MIPRSSVRRPYAEALWVVEWCDRGPETRERKPSVAWIGCQFPSSAPGWGLACFSRPGGSNPQASPFVSGASGSPRGHQQSGQR